MNIYNKLKIYSLSEKVEFISDRTRYFIEQAKGKKILHVGCTDFPITESRIRSNTLVHNDLTRVASEILGIDISEEGIRLLNKNGISNVIVMNAEQLEISEKFDLILAGDVVEHMSNPGLFLSKITDLLVENGELIVSVPSAYSINVLKLWLNSTEQVHKDHVAYYSPKTLSSLCERFALLPTKLVFTAQPQDEYESSAFVAARNLFLQFSKHFSPSLIMHFKDSAHVDAGRFFLWG